MNTSTINLQILKVIVISQVMRFYFRCLWYWYFGVTTSEFRLLTVHYACWSRPYFIQRSLAAIAGFYKKVIYTSRRILVHCVAPPSNHGKMYIVFGWDYACVDYCLDHKILAEIQPLLLVDIYYDTGLFNTVIIFQIQPLLPVISAFNQKPLQFYSIWHWHFTWQLTIDIWLDSPQYSFNDNT